MRPWHGVVAVLAVSLGTYFWTRPREEATEIKRDLDVVAQTASFVKPADPLRDDPLGYLESCLERCEKEVRGYVATFRKQERVEGRLLKRETIVVRHLAQPFSVHMDWLEGEGRAKKVLYVEGKNQGKMLVRPKGPLGFVVLSKDPEGSESKASGRFPVTQFGMIHGMRSTVESMRRAKANGTLHVRYEGLAKLPELGERPVHCFIRTPYDPPELDGIGHLTVFVDPDTGLQVGSIVKTPAGDLLGEYFFGDIRLNPDFEPNQFERAGI